MTRSRRTRNNAGRRNTAIMAGGGLLLLGAFGAGIVIWAVAIFLNARGARSFTRDRMAARL